MMDSFIGAKGEMKRKVTQDMLASSVGSGIAAVFATPMMIAGIEETAAASVQGFLGEEKSTVGINVN
ncbi:MAG: thioesterase, partial [Oscillospiraceae bacterium]